MMVSRSLVVVMYNSVEELLEALDTDEFTGPEVTDELIEWFKEGMKMNNKQLDSLIDEIDKKVEEIEGEKKGIIFIVHEHNIDNEGEGHCMSRSYVINSPRRYAEAALEVLLESVKED